MNRYIPFEPLPPVPKISTFRLSLIFNTIYHQNSHPTSTALSPTRTTHHDVTLSALSHLAVEEGKTSTADSSVTASGFNDPYTPWPNHIRPLIISPPTSVSRSSQYSRPYSRSGARAPEPPVRRACGLFGWRRAKRNIQGFSKRLPLVKTLLSRHRRNLSRTPATPNRNHLRVSSLTFSIVSGSSSFGPRRSLSFAISSVRDSLGSWIDTRNRASIGYMISPSPGHVSMDIDEYERRGSWLTDPDRGCGLDACVVHHPQGTERSEVWKYLDVSLAAGSAATRRRRKDVNGLTSSMISEEVSSD